MPEKPPPSAGNRLPVQKMCANAPVGVFFCATLHVVCRLKNYKVSFYSCLRMFNLNGFNAAVRRRENAAKRQFQCRRAAARQTPKKRRKAAEAAARQTKKQQYAKKNGHKAHYPHKIPYNA